MSRWRALVALVPLAAAAALSAPTFGGRPPHAVRAAEAGGPAAGSLRLYATNPVLVRAGERVLMPVDVACATAGERACDAVVTLSTRVPGEAWRAVSAPAARPLRFDLTAPAARAAASGPGFVEFHLRAEAADGGVASLGGPQQGRRLRFHVTGSLPAVAVPAVPFGRTRPGREQVFVPWGSGPSRAGVSLGNESATLGPPSFEVDRAGRVHLADALQGRVATFAGAGLAGETRMEMEPRAAVAADGAGHLHVADAPEGSVRVRSVSAAGEVTAERRLGAGTVSEIRAVGDAVVVRVLPLDAWVHTRGPAAGTSTVGLPDGAGSHTVRIGREGSVRVASIAEDGTVRGVELISDLGLGEVALAEPDGHGGFVVVVRVGRDGPDPADHFQVLRVVEGRVVRSFAVESGDFAQALPLGRFRLGPGPSLYRMASSPEGIHVLRFDLGGTS